MNRRLPAVAQFAADTGFPQFLPDRIHRSKTRYMAAFNGPSSLLHTIEVLQELRVSLRRARLLPDIGRALEPETRLYRVEAYEEGVTGVESEYAPIRVSINVREDNRLRRFLPLLAIGLPTAEMTRAWRQGRVTPTSQWDPEKPSPPLSLLEGFHRFYLEPGAMPADWTNQITPAERLALQLCQRLREIRDPADPPEQIADRMLIVAGSRFDERDNPLGGIIVNPNDSLISQIGTALELVEVFMTQAMLTVAGGDVLGGFEFVIPFEPPEGRSIALILNQSKNASYVTEWFRNRKERWPNRTYLRPDSALYNQDGKKRRGDGKKCRWDCEEYEVCKKPGGQDCVQDTDSKEDKRVPEIESAVSEVAKWFNAYPHRKTLSFQERLDPQQNLDASPSPTLWSTSDPGVRQAAERVADWYQSGSVKEEAWDRNGATLKYKLPGEPLEAEDMLSLARAYLPDFLPDYPRQVFVSGGMNVEGLLLGLISHWLRAGSFLGMDYSDWALFSPEQQVVLCGLLVQRSRRIDQCAVFEAAVRLLIDYRDPASEEYPEADSDLAEPPDEGVKTWIENFRKEKIGLDRPDRASPLAQLGFCLPLGGYAALHAPSMKVRIPCDYTRHPEAKQIERKLHILAELFLPAHILVQHIWKIDWVKLGETAYLKRVVNPVNPDLIPEGVRLYDGSD